MFVVESIDNLDGYLLVAIRTMGKVSDLEVLVDSVWLIALPGFLRVHRLRIYGLGVVDHESEVLDPVAHAFLL